MLTVVETPMFLRYVDGVMDEAERDAFVNFIAANPEAGDVIAGAAPLRKVRWSRPGMGKRAGARVIYFTKMADGTVHLLIAYPKSKTDNLSPVFLRELRKLLLSDAMSKRKDEEMSQFERDLLESVRQALRGEGRVTTAEEIKRRVGRPPQAVHKAPVTLRMDPHALERWRASGKGWQTRAAALLASHAP